MALSALCLVHCLALPLLLAVLPVLLGSFVSGEAFHRWMLLAVVPTSAWALIGGVGRHGVRAPLMIAAVGIALLTLAAFGGSWFGLPESGDTGLTVVGGLLLAAAHSWNVAALHHGHDHAPAWLRRHWR